MSDTYHPSSFSSRSASLNLIYVPPVLYYMIARILRIDKGEIRLFIYIFQMDIIYEYSESM